MAYYDFNLKKWVESPAQPSVSMFVGPAMPTQTVKVQPKSAVTSQPKVVPATQFTGPVKPLPKLEVKPLQTQAKLNVTTNPGSQTQQTYNPQQAASGQTVLPAGKNLDLTKLQNLKVSGVNGTPAPVYQQTAPRLNTPIVDTIYKTFNQNTWADKLLRPIAGFGLTLFSGPLEYVKNLTEAGYINNELADQVARGIMPYEAIANQDIMNKTNFQLVGDSALAVMDIYMPGVGKKLLVEALGKSGALEVVKQLTKQGAKEGFATGIPYGVALATSSGVTDPKEFAKIVAASTVVGTALGALISGGPAALRMGSRELKNLQKKFESELIAQGIDPLRAKQLATQGGYIGGVSNEKPKIDIDPLTTEARKYKSAEEFVNSQPKLYHGTNQNIDSFEPRKSGSNRLYSFLTEDKNVADIYAKQASTSGGKPTIIEAVHNGSLLDFTQLKNTDKRNIAQELRGFIKQGNYENNSKTRQAQNFINQLDAGWQPDPVLLSENNVFKDFLESKGKDGYIVLSDGRKFIAVTNSKIKTKSQLTDIWNKANQAPTKSLPELKQQRRVDKPDSIAKSANESADLRQSQKQLSESGSRQPQPLPEVHPKISKSESYGDSIARDKISFNYEKYNIKPEAKIAIKKEIENNAKLASKYSGQTMHHEEWLKRANKIEEAMDRVVSREEQVDMLAKAYNTERRLARVAEDFDNGTATIDQLFDAFDEAKSLSEFRGRFLEAAKESVDPAERTLIQRILEDLAKRNKDTDKVRKALRDANWADPESVITAYRNEVRATLGNWVDLIRYNSMLSSPNTHIVNMASNFEGTGLLRPIMQTAYGVFDPIRAALTRSPRQRFTGEGLAYAKGYYTAIGKAKDKVIETMRRGQAYYESGGSIPLTKKGTMGRKAENSLAIVSMILEAEDQFFKTLTSAGVENQILYRAKKGATTGPVQLQGKDLSDFIQKTADKELMRGQLGEETSKILGLIDWLPKSIQDAKNSQNGVIRNIAKLTFPFVRFGTNALKTGVEYGPLGITTLPGSANKYEQFVKFAVGTASTVGVAMLAGEDRLSGPEPIDEAGKGAWRDAGRKPWAVKIGDKWVSFQKLHPALSFNLALIVAVKDGIEQNKLSEDKADVILSTFGKYANFLYDQSYMRNIGDIAAAIKGDKLGVSKFISNVPQQFVPYRAMLSWVSRLIDDTERQVDPSGKFLEKQMQYMMLQLPGLSNNIPARLGPDGLPIKKTDKWLNALSPFGPVGTVNPEAEKNLQERKDLSFYTKKVNKENDVSTRNAEQLFSKMGSMSDEEKQSAFAALDEKGRDKFLEIIDKREKDLNYFEQGFKSAPVDARGQYLYNKVKDMDIDQRTELIGRLTEKDLLTDETLDALIKAAEEDAGNGNQIKAATSTLPPLEKVTPPEPVSKIQPLSSTKTSPLLTIKQPAPDPESIDSKPVPGLEKLPALTAALQRLGKKPTQKTEAKTLSNKITSTLRRVFPQGSIGGQCITFLHKIVDFPQIGDFIGDKRRAVAEHGIPLGQWKKDVRVGDIVVTNEDKTYGHGYMIEEILPDGRWRVLESNRNYNQKVTHDRIVSPSNPNIIGAIRGKIKV